MRRAVILGLAIGLAIVPALARGDAAREIDGILRQDVARGFSGAVLIAHGAKLVRDKGYGAIGGTPVRAKSRFWIASGGKQFVSAAILKCAERGWLRLGDPLSRFIPDAPADKRAITIRQLLAHLSGLDQTYASEQAATRDEAVAHILAPPPIDKPGVKFHYSNDNYELAAAIVEIASGEDYRGFVTRHLWQPLGMRDTGFNFSGGAKAVLPAREATPERLLKPAWGEAGVYSTAHDLFIWYRALRAGRVLAPATVKELFAAATPIQEGQAAFGWFLGRTARGTATIFTRGNEDFGPNALIYAYPSRDRLVIVLTHAGDADDDRSWSRVVLAQIEAAEGL